MFNIVKKTRGHVNLTLKSRRESKKIVEAQARVLRDQQVRYEMLTYLSANGLLKENVY